MRPFRCVSVTCLRGVGAVAFAALLVLDSHAAPSPCSEGPSSLRASIVAIDPPNGEVVAVRGRDRRKVAPLDYVCAGETISPADGVRVEILEGGKRVTVMRAGHLVRGAPSLPDQAQQYLSLVFDVVGGLRPARPRAMPTGVRGGEGATSGYERVRLLSALRDLPRQSIVAPGALVLGWRGGSGPYECRALSEDLTERWRSAPTMESWCEVPGAAAETSRLEVLDGRGARVGINVVPARWGDIPRPPWPLADADRPSTLEASAWAAWLWRSADARWRLQALGRLHRLSAEEIVASQFLERALDESLPTER